LSYKKTNIIICGAGSIGIRHAKNLISLGYKNIIFFTKRKKLVIGNLKFKTFSNLNEALYLYKPRIAFVTNETSKHIKSAIECSKIGAHLFIEKPLTHNKKRVQELLKSIKQKKIVNMVGYMMRFHPGIKIIKDMITSRKLGEVYHFNSEWGEYLPNWHPKENFRKSYAAVKNKGGGALLTLSHDIDLIQYFFGKIKNINKYKSKLGLKINAETSADIMIKFDKNISGFIHVDYLQKRTSRYLKIIGTKLIIEFYFLKNILFIDNGLKIKKINFKGFKRNDLFISEIKYFLIRCKNKRQCSPSIEESYNNLISSQMI